MTSLLWKQQGTPTAGTVNFSPHPPRSLSNICAVTEPWLVTIYWECLPIVYMSTFIILFISFYAHNFGLSATQGRTCSTVVPALQEAPTLASASSATVAAEPMPCSSDSSAGCDCAAICCCQGLSWMWGSSTDSRLKTRDRCVTTASPAGGVQQQHQQQASVILWFQTTRSEVLLHSVATAAACCYCY